LNVMMGNRFDTSMSRGTIRGGTYTAHRNASDVSSWTVDASVITRLVDDFGQLYRKNPKSYHVLLVATTKKNPDGFLINPDEYEYAPTFAGQFSYQKEILSTGPIALEYTVYCDKDELGGDDRKIVSWLLSRIES